jgi:peroxiredoxin
VVLASAVCLVAAIATGPATGAKVPDFSLPDQTGQSRAFADLTGPSGLVLVFYRSADW